MKRYTPKWMDVLVCPKGHQGIYLNGKPFCLECQCPIVPRGKTGRAEQAEDEPRDDGTEDTE